MTAEDVEAVARHCLEYLKRHDELDDEGKLEVLRAVLANRDPDPNCRTALDWWVMHHAAA